MAFLGDIGKIVARAATAVVTGGISEISPEVRQAVEPVVGGVVTGELLVKSLTGGLAPQPSVPIVIGALGSTLDGTRIASPGATPAGIGGGPAAFSRFTPPPAGGGNPAWLSSGTSVRFSVPGSTSSAQRRAGGWVVSGASVRRS